MIRAIASIASDASLRSALTTTPTIQPNGSDDKVNVRGTDPEAAVFKNGIKMSGMASYGKVHNDDEIWNVVAFVQRLPNMTPEEYGRFEKEAQ